MTTKQGPQTPWRVLLIKEWVGAAWYRWGRWWAAGRRTPRCRRWSAGWRRCGRRPSAARPAGWRTRASGPRSATACWAPARPAAPQTRGHAPASSAGLGTQSTALALDWVTQTIIHLIKNHTRAFPPPPIPVISPPPHSFPPGHFPLVFSPSHFPPIIKNY